MVKCINLRTLLITCLILLVSFVFATISCAVIYDTGKIRIAVFPFNDVQSEYLDMSIPAVLRAELSRYDFIEIVPVEVIREKIYEIEPSFLWTEREGVVNTGGILWKMEPIIVEEVRENISAQISIYGDVVRFGDKWRIDAYISKKKIIGPEDSLNIASIDGLKYEEIPDKLKELAKEIAGLLKKDHVLSEAEEDIRRYKGGQYTYSTVIKKMEGHVNLYPKSIPLRALLLDLYLKEKEKNREKVINEGLKIINLYDPSREEDVRYLLSLSLDPFDAAAEAYEKKEDWKNAIYLRNKAVKLFPLGKTNHKNGLGHDHYFFALSLEMEGQNAEALESYRKATTYLQPNSTYYEAAVKGVERLKER
jgi:tetratricopeptide (TPR) repeat protein